MRRDPDCRSFSQGIFTGARTISGRFAPSPTGTLHFGSLVSALASYLDARHSGRPWLLRVEDIDPPREVAGSAQSILHDLNKLGLEHDGEVLFQSSRTAAYFDAMQHLLSTGRAFRCGCSRKDLPESGIYPGTCRQGVPRGKTPRAVRLKVEDRAIRFDDRVQGAIGENLAETCGDFVIWRADDLPAYQLAVVVDDAYQDVDSVVRGADLLDSTARQIWLQHCLGLAQPEYAHLPLAVDAQGKKLSKRSQSDPVARAAPASVILDALEFLGQAAPGCAQLEDVLAFAIRHWSIDRVPRSLQAAAPFARAGGRPNHL